MATSYLLKIKLLDSHYPIWRQFVVPSDITLAHLHDVIQTVMGWEDGHMHVFIIDKQEYISEFDIFDDPLADKGLPEDDYTLDSLAARKGKKFEYLYDFGDSWMHKIVIENTNYDTAADQAAIFCVKGTGHCPPEDCGGVYGFADFCEAMANPKHPEHKDMLMWYGGDFEPNDFDIDDVNNALGKMFAPKKTAKKSTKKAAKKAVKKTVKKTAKKKTAKVQKSWVRRGK